MREVGERRGSCAGTSERPSADTMRHARVRVAAVRTEEWEWMDRSEIEWLLLVIYLGLFTCGLGFYTGL